MFLRRLFRQKCQESNRYNPFNTDIDFQFLPLRTKVEILYALCDFRLDAEDVFDLFKNLEAESLRVEPLGWDDNLSAYWYFYGTRLYREDHKPKSKSKKKKSKEEKRKKKLYGDDWLDDPDTERVWQVICFTEADWNNLTAKFKGATSRVEKELYHSLSENFLPEIPRLFQEKERLQRKRLLEFAPRRTSNRVLQKIKQKEEEDKSSSETKETDSLSEERDKRERIILSREHRAKRREQLRTKSESSDSSDDSSSSESIMPPKDSKNFSKSKQKTSKNSPTMPKGEPPPQSPPPPDPPVKTGRKTNNSLACATGQIVIPDTNEAANSNSTRKILKGSQIFSQSEEDVQTDMYKVLEQLTAHEDAWPFMDPVEEEYAPNYYAVIRRPMDLRTMEERLDSGHYTDFNSFKSDFKLIVNNCRLYNGHDNEYTQMVDNLQEAFDRLTEKYVHRASSSDEEIAVEYQIPTPSRKHKIKSPEEESPPKKKKTSSSNTDDAVAETSQKEIEKHSSKEEKSTTEGSTKEERKSKEGKTKKKHKQHHHSKHSKSHKKNSHHKSGKKESKHAKRSKKDKHRKSKKHKHTQKESEIVIKRSSSNESLESSSRSRSASPLPSIHSTTPTPSPSPPPTPSPSPTDRLSDPDFFKDKYDKIKERRRQAAKDKDHDNIGSTTEKQLSSERSKPNFSLTNKDKHQKLRETIEKLKAKNEKYKEALIFNNLFSGNSQNSADKSSASSEVMAETSLKDIDQFDYPDSDNSSQKSTKTSKGKKERKKGTKKVSVKKNESATEALEQAVKDISKWLDEEPKSSVLSTSSESPAPTVSTEEQDSRLDDDSSSDKILKRDIKKRLALRDSKVGMKKRDLHRTIERLQPGKSKGNLIASSTITKVEEVVPLGPHNKPREIKSVLTTKVDELSPKLSLGSVLPAVGFTLGKDHKFSEDDVKPPEKPKAVEVKTEKPKKETETKSKIEVKKKIEPPKVEVKPSEDTKERSKSPKFSQEKATPNLSAWFKAFGAPKSTPTTTATTTTKKKNEEPEQEEIPEEKPGDNKPLVSPKSVHKYDSPLDEISPTAEGGDSPIPQIISNARQRRTSTGSSVSERSSFSQDLDSPRHQMSHTSPQLRSPASPRTDDFQKISYPIINGTVRAGFYQDTASIKSSPEKSCSPRDGPQSPYSPYSQHVYASNSASTPNSNYLNDLNNSPLPTYGLNHPPPYYDSSKAPLVNKPLRTHDHYTSLGPDTYQHKGKIKHPGSSPSHSPYSQHSPHSPIPNSPQTVSQPSPANTTVVEPKTSLFPVKKRTYTEDTSVSKSSQSVDMPTNLVDHSKDVSNKDDYQKLVQAISTFGSEVMVTSVDDIALALSKKSDSKIKDSTGYIEKSNERSDVPPNYNGGSRHSEDISKHGVSNEKQAEKSGSVDMINMGYFVSEFERRSNISDADLINTSRELQKSKGYDIGAIAMNLGINKGSKYNQPSKQTPKMSEHMNPNILDFENIHAANQSVANFGVSDYEAANKKFYSGSAPVNTPIDYGNWKNDNQMRKTSDSMQSSYQSNFPMDNAELNKMKSNMNIPNPHVSNYSKPMHSPQLQVLPGARAPMHRSSLPQNMPSELRIPNPRGMMNMADMTMTDSEIMKRNIEAHNHALSMQKTDKPKSTASMSNQMQYKTHYSNQTSVPLDSLRNIPVSYLSSDERYLSSFATSASSLYDKSHQMSQMFNKSLPSDAHAIASASIYSQASVGTSKESMAYKTPTASVAQADKMKQRRKKTETKNPPMSMNQTYHSQATTSDVLTSVKNSLVPGSAFNFGPGGGMTLGSGLYSDGSGFSLENFRNTTANQFMAANYMVAAAAAHQRTTNEANAEKLVKPAHQNTAHTSTGAFPFIGHGQARGSYPFVGTDPSSPLYQQYLQRQEELLGAQIMSLYPPAYHSGGLGVRQPYDSINRPPWL